MICTKVKKEKSSGRTSTAVKYRRTYTWDERNMLISSVDANYSTSYVYGQRSNKYTDSSETLYFNKMWTLHTDSGNIVDGGQYAKNIYLGDTRIVTKLKGTKENTTHEETYKQYFYHSDHLGSAALITDYNGDEYQRIEYTPYGETWVEKTQNAGLEYLPYKFTGKEMDEETGLYYYGARYLDPKYSRWISTDPALGEYIPAAGKGNSENAGNLPGMGGIYNHINGDLYHYAGNNPVRYIDPDGRKINLSNTSKENYNAILFIINQMSILQYKITNDGKLEIDAGTLNRNGSETFNRDMLYAFCSDFDISISFGNHVPDYIDVESPEVFGGTSYFYKDKKEAFIVLATTNYPKMRAKDGSYYFASSYETFCHELAGHIVPEIKNENGNAVSIENEICQQLGWIEREEEPDHASF